MILNTVEKSKKIFLKMFIAVIRCYQSVLSWESNRAKVYRKLIGYLLGSAAVNVQSMVFGNMGNDCATGVVFTRNPLMEQTKFTENIL